MYILNLKRKSLAYPVLLLCVCFVTACSLPGFVTSFGVTSNTPIIISTSSTIQSPSFLASPTISLDRFPSPTPDAQRVLPPLRTETVQYTIQPNDTLAAIARRYGVGMSLIAQTNHIENPDLIQVGQTLVIPPPVPVGSSPDFKIIPDSELVLSPSIVSFDIDAFIQEKGGYLEHYSEDVDGETLSGSQIIQRIANNYSVNPRILLAMIEYQSGWVTQATIPENLRDYPLGDHYPWARGLYLPMGWAANMLNQGYYLWRVNGISSWVLADDQVVRASPLVNSGTAAVQNLLSMLYGYTDWQKAVTTEGIISTYTRLFGNPFENNFDPLLPQGLTQPVLQLPFETGAVWYFTGGPHGSWGSGSAWGALDFAPSGEGYGCIQSDAWVVAAASGLIVRSANGAVVQDLDGDGFEQTGWTILYLHIESRDRVVVGSFLSSGDRIGHPSCEGGESTGTHLHLARRYNGEWIPADGNLPFNLDGWTSQGSQTAYNGFLKRDQNTIEALDGRETRNQIQR